MICRPDQRCVRGVVAAFTCLLLIHSAHAEDGQVDNIPAWTDAAIEADWLRQDELRLTGPATQPAPRVKVSLAEDAAGGVDGVTDGLWGFHTENEQDPWWQVDLGEVTAIDRVVLYNRCDNNMGSRNRRIILWLSDDGQTFIQAYQHDGTDFLGHTDKKPLVVDLAGKRGRYLRVGLKGTSYFHLDEVQVYATDGSGKPSEKNVALGKPATQSSLSQWSAPSKKVVARSVSDIPLEELDIPFIVTDAKPIYVTLDRGHALLAHLETHFEPDAALEKQIDQTRKSLDDIAKRLVALAAEDKPSSDELRKLYLTARWTVRRLALSNPLIDFDSILFVKRQPGMFPHVSDQYYGWWSRPGGGICILSGINSGGPTVKDLTADWPAGNFLRPELSFDGKRVLFAYCRHYPHVAGVADKTRKEDLPEDAFYHIYQMNLDGTNVRQLTHGYYDDFDARYLPDGDIIFLSTRKGTSLIAGRESAAATCASTCPDSYVRCGGGNHRPVAVFTLHRMNADGGDMLAISAFENFEWTPAVAWDGRIFYARWDYIDRFNGHFMSLWSTNPDGTNSQLVYGNYTKRPQCIFEPRPIPGSTKLIFTATAHHSITGGSLVLLDRTRGTEEDRPITRLTPEVCFPETEGWPGHYYHGAWPLSETFHLVGWADRKLPAHRLMPPDDPNNPGNAMGIYLLDAFGNLTLLHRDPEISSMNPIPIRPRRVPQRIASVIDHTDPPEGRFLLQDVYAGLDGVPRGEIDRLRVVGVLPKVQPQMNSPALSVSREDTGKFVLGTVPIEEDGSAYFRVPSGIPYFFQALDNQGRAIQTMRSLTYVQPGQTLGCVGCHESRDSAALSESSRPQALAHEPSKVRLDPTGAWPLRFDTLVQPVLDAKCVTCHGGGKDPKAAHLNLTAAVAYDNLIAWSEGNLKNLIFERDASPIDGQPARHSKLTKLLTDGDGPGKGHAGVKLSPEELYRFYVWMDTYGHKVGSFSEGQEQELEALKEEMRGLLE